MSREPDPIPVSEAVRRAVTACDSQDEALQELERRCEDRDEPITGNPALGAELEQIAGDLRRPPQDPALEAALATIRYLAEHPADVDSSDARLVGLAVRHQFEGSPPEELLEWMRERDLEAR